MRLWTHKIQLHIVFIAASMQHIAEEIALTFRWPATHRERARAEPTDDLQKPFRRKEEKIFPAQEFPIITYISLASEC